MRRTDRKINRPQGASAGTGPLFGGVSAGECLTTVAVCLLVGMAPLVYWPEVYDCDLSPKFFAIHVCTALACLGWVLRARRGETSHPVFPPLLLPLACGMGVALLSAPGATHGLDTAVELVNRAAFIVLFWVVAGFLSTKRLGPVLWAGAAGGLVVAVIGILQYHGLAFEGIPSAALPSATFGNRNFAAMYLACAIPLAGLLFLTAQRPPALAVSGLSATLMAVFLVYTRTRSAWVGLGGALMGASLLVALCPGLRRPVMEALRPHLDRRRKGWRWGFLGLFLLLSALPPLRASALREGGLPTLPGQKSGVIATAASIIEGDGKEEGDQSRQSRLTIWGVTFRMIADHPLLGVGPGGWKRAYPPYDAGATTTPIGSYKNPHNDYLWIASEYGLIGLGVYLCLLAAAFRRLLATVRNGDVPARLVALSVSLSLLATLGDACFNFPVARPQSAAFFYLLLGVAAAVTPGEKIGGSRAAFLLVPCLALAVALSAASLSWRRVGFSLHYFRAVQQAEYRKDWPATLSEVRRALQYGLFQPHILIFQGAALEGLNDYAGAEAAYRRVLACTPHAWRAHACLCYALMQQGKFGDALVHGQAALSLCPTALDNRYNLGVVYQMMGDLDRAEGEFQAILKTHPENAEARLNLGALYRFRGQLDSAAVHYQRVLRSNPDMPQAHLNLAQVCLGQGRIQDALAHYRSALQAYPDNPDVHWGIGFALEAGGHPEQAELAYRKAIALQPGFAQAHLSLGEVCYAQGRYREALAFYQSFLGLAPNDTANVRRVRERITRCQKM